MSDNKMITIDSYHGIRTSEVMKLVSEDDPILHKETIEFDFANPPMKPDHLAASLFETMFLHKGVGLSANQVGLPYRVFVTGMDKDNKQVFFNPVILQQSEEEVKLDEGCLSFPNMYMKVSRPIAVRIRWQHVTGEEREETYHGLTGRIILHEYDHMMGKVFTDMVGKTTLMMAKEKRAKFEKKLNRRGGQLDKKISALVKK